MHKQCSKCGRLLPTDDATGLCAFHQPEAVAARQAAQSARAAEFAAIREKHGLFPASNADAKPKP